LQGSINAKNLNTYCAVVSEVSSFMGNRVVDTNKRTKGIFGNFIE